MTGWNLPDGTTWTEYDRHMGNGPDPTCPTCGHDWDLADDTCPACAEEAA